MKGKRSPYRLIMGQNCVRELLKANPERIVTLYLAPGIDLKAPQIKCKTVSKAELTQMVHSDSHQGVVAAVKERGSRSLKEFCQATEEQEKSVILLLDQLFDPHNVGAILRAAECFGVDAVIYSKNRGTDITPVVSKVSSGASELVELIRVSNLAESLKPLKQAGYTIIAAEAKETSIPLNTFSFPDKAAIILGSEGSGIQRLLSERSDIHLMIPMHGQIDSLNVSQAAAVILSRCQA